MFLKTHRVLKDGKTHIYYSLCESLRVSRKRVLQRQVLHLGELNTTQFKSWQRTIEEILSKVVYAERAHPVEMISKVSLGGLLDLFLTVDEFDARYDFGEQFRTVEPAPVFLGFQAQFKDHGQCRDS